MSKRLQVLLDEAELRDVREAARRQGMPVSEWVRRALREARRREPRSDIDAKVRAIRSAARHDFPSADIDQMIEEIERGYAPTAPE
jgi:Ribbon-helix-helix protein, copG family